MDNLGRYSLAEMEQRVFRLLNQGQAVISNTGVESGFIIQGQAFSTVDIDQQINASLVALYTEIVQNREDQFSQTFYVSVLANNIGPYAFPLRMLQLRYLDWLPPGITQANAQPRDWQPMVFMADPMNRQMEDDHRAPTWQYDNSGMAFILGRNPSQANPNGVRIKAVVLPSELVNSTDVIQARFAQVMQQAVIFDTAFVLAGSHLRQMPETIPGGREEWHQRLVTTAENAHKPPSTQMMSSRMPVMTYSGRRRIRGGW